MKAVVCQNTELKVRELKSPRPGRGQVLLKVLRCGTVGLSGVAAAFDALRDPEAHAKILIDPTQQGASIR